MKTTVIILTKKIIAYFMIGVMIVFIANTAVFSHVHKLSDGTVIEHAHPYDKASDSAPYKSHHHTNAGLLFFQNLGLLFLIAFFTYTLIVFFEKVKYSFYTLSKHISAYIILYKGRAPPIF